MHQERIECKVPSNIKAEINSNKALLHLKTVGDYIAFCYNTTSIITNLAKEQGVKMEDMPAVVNKLLKNETVQNTLIECFRQIAESK